MLALHVLFYNNSKYSQGGRETYTYKNERHFFDWHCQICGIMMYIYIMKDSYQYMHFWEDIPYARYIWDRNRPNKCIFGLRIPCVRYFSQNSFLNFYPKNVWFSCYFKWPLLNPHILHIFKLKNERFWRLWFFCSKRHLFSLYLFNILETYTYRIYWKKAYISGFWNFPATSKNTGCSVSKWVPPFWSYPCASFSGTNVKVYA